MLEVMTWIMYDDGYAPAVDFFGPSLDKEWLSPVKDEVSPLISFAESYSIEKI
jgi:hypothetical protein